MREGALAAFQRFWGPLLGLFLALGVWAPTLGAAGIEPPGLLDQGRALLQARAYELALNRFQLIEKNSDNPGERALALRMVGETQFRNADYASAYQAYQRSLLLTPLSSSRLSLEFKESVSLVYLKKYRSALDKLTALESRAGDKGLLTDLYFWEGECYYQLGRFDEARREYEKIFATNLHYRYVYLVRYLESWCAFEQKDYAEALRGFGEVGAKTDDPVLRKLSAFQVAEALYRSGRYAEAEKAYAAFADQYPGDRLGAAARYGLGWALEKEKRYAEAVRAFDRVVADAPQDPLAPWAAVREGVDASAAGQTDQAR
ncbi:MAG TPA: tetratricopeptide repeat protein, partial [bacterium]|nr:tetratricopeptide repeat protein [bacterium]